MARGAATPVRPDRGGTPRSEQSPGWPGQARTPTRAAAIAGLLDLLPQGAIDPTLLSEEDQRDLYDAFHLQVRYDRPKHQVTLRVTIYAEAVGVLTDKIHSLRNGEWPKRVDGDETAVVADAAITSARSLVVGAPGGSRTTWERAAAGQNGVFVVVDGVWPLPPRGPRSL